MIVGSLFSGIGGLDHGLARAGFRHAFFCESDPWRRTVLAAHWPGVPVYDDVRTVGEPAGRAAADGCGAPANCGGWEAGAGLLSGGFPCQDLSVAGKRAGLDAGARSGLFFEFARVIDTLRPRWVLIENVSGLLSSEGGRDFGTVIGTLADLGYGVAWRVLDSRFFGVPQRRRRVFIVGTLALGDPRAAAERAGEILAVGTSCFRHPPSGREAGPDIAVASLSGLGNGGPDDNDGQAGRLVASTLKGQRGKGGGGIGVEETLIADTVRSHPRPGSDGNGNVTAFHQTQEPIHRNEFTPAIGATSIGMGVGIGATVRRLTPTECERLQALPDGWTNPNGDAPDSRRYAALGDAVTASVGEWIGRRIIAANQESAA